MKVDLSSCSVVELGKNCILRVTGEATLVGVRGEQWATIRGCHDDFLMVSGSELPVGPGREAVIVGLKEGAIRVLEPTRGSGWPARWLEALTQRWIGWFSEQAGQRHAERQWGVV